eukprot:TRINITY_DN7478_c0_g3_i4.p1 TRINITY_DN7478_c0_g3~~TRINITY_DN7478_c0_g3_i4.p1  ORF type:complete len:322 (+),score=65.61 TRINITY_DN7478_c0_g3_i4:64-966(+)
MCIRDRSKIAGYLSNTLRVTVSNFLVKVLLIDWQEGVKYYANTMLDYDVAQCNGGWQWSASCGYVCCPYTVIYDPFDQSIKLDKHCAYIWTWIPELKGVPKEHIHQWGKFHHLYAGKVDYPTPIVDYQKQKQICLDLFRSYEEYEENEGLIDIDVKPNAKASKGKGGAPSNKKKPVPKNDDDLDFDLEDMIPSKMMAAGKVDVGDSDDEGNFVDEWAIPQIQDDQDWTERPAGLGNESNLILVNCMNIDISWTLIVALQNDQQRGIKELMGLFNNTLFKQTRGRLIFLRVGYLNDKNVRP